MATSMESSALRPSTQWVIRLVVGFLVLGGLYLSVRLELGKAGQGIELFTEHSWVEATHVLFPLLAAVLVLMARPDDDDHPLPLRWLFAALLASLGIRETDYWLDDYVFDGAWQILVIGVLAACAWAAWPNRRLIKAELQDYLQSTSWGILASGWIVMIFSRFFGMSVFWMRLMGDNFDRSVKNAVEESLESVAFALFVWAALEYWLANRWNRNPSAESVQ